jgi:hypothetical protein
MPFQVVNSHMLLVYSTKLDVSLPWFRSSTGSSLRLSATRNASKRVLPGAFPPRQPVRFSV